MSNDEQAPQTGLERGGWTPVYREVWTHYLPVIGKDALLYYLYLLDRRQTKVNDPRYGKAWPGRNTVAATLGIAKKQLVRIDTVLEASGLVDIERVATTNGKSRIQYVVHDPKPATEVDVEKLMATVETALQASGDIGNHTGDFGNRGGFDGNMINTYLSIPIDKDLINNCDAKDDQESKDDDAPKPVASYNSRDILRYFLSRYKERYGVEYVASFARDCSLIKKKLLAAFPPERVVAIIDIVFDRYASEWSSTQYPRPTLGAICGWLANKASAYIVDDTAERAEEAQQSPVYDYQTMKERGLL